MEAVQSFLEENIKGNEPVVIGVSGGADSMLLLVVLERLFPPKNIICAHINHNLREESEEEFVFVKEYCESHHITFEGIKFEYEDKFSEKIAREMRYAFFEEVLTKYNSHTLLTAHHGDDLIETVLMRLVRGSTMKGYSGIELISKRENYKILRPLLFLTKKDIYEYMDPTSYREDRTNEDESYTRNRYRKQILPFLKEENAQVHLKFLNYSQTVQDYFRYVENDLDRIYPTIVHDSEIDISKYMELDEFMQNRVLERYLFFGYQDNIDRIGNAHMENLKGFIQNGETNTYIDLPDNYRATKEYNILKLVLQGERQSYSFQLEDKILLPNGKTIEKIESSEDTSNFTTYLDCSEVFLPLTVRTYQDGDKMAVKNMDGHKKISDIFTDEKVKITDRELWPVVVDKTGQIIWLPGLKKSCFDNKKSEKYDIIFKYY